MRKPTSNLSTLMMFTARSVCAFFGMLTLSSCGQPVSRTSQMMNANETRMQEVTEEFFVSPLDQARSLQVMTVTTPSWNSTSGVLRLFSRDTLNSPWKKTGFEVDVMIGRAGLAWGRGLHPNQTPLKQEGDGKAPAGIFSLGIAFGYEAAVNTQLRYQQMSGDHWCVDDASRPQYNQIVKRSAYDVGQSTEKMLRTDRLYKYGIFVNHNLPAVKNGGSCIFMHVWRGPGLPTSGCTAMTEDNIKSLLALLDSAKNPLLISLPADVYQAYRSAWGLPVIWN
jgi:D-alanyl-D-alanine dipeptidase